jgi:hypothetical protein
MMHIELHVLETADDVPKAELAGLIELTDEELCEHCGDAVGFDRYNVFTPLAVVLNEDSVWVMCVNCVEPILDPIVYEGTED